MAENESTVPDPSGESPRLHSRHDLRGELAVASATLQLLELLEEQGDATPAYRHELMLRARASIDEAIRMIDHPQP